VEVTFYAALPAYVLAARRLTDGLDVRAWMRTELGLLAALATISVVLRHVSETGPASWLGGTVGGLVLWFALGMSVAIVSVATSGTDSTWTPIRFVREHPTLLWSGAGLAYLGLCLLLPATPFFFERGYQTLAHLGLAAIALLLFLPSVFPRSNSLPSRVLANPIIGWLGLISYGIFLALRLHTRAWTPGRGSRLSRRLARDTRAHDPRGRRRLLPD
jgi:peptidoglycan/LPS O-acetylase OafA/YrhL